MILDPQHESFVNFYFELNFNQTKAAIKAGYARKSARNQGYRLMKNDDIRAEIDRRLADMAMSKHEVLGRLALHGRGDMREFINRTPKQLANHPEGNLIKKFEHTITTTTLRNGSVQKEEKIKVELYDAQAATVQMGRYYKLFTDKTDLTSDDQPVTINFVKVEGRKATTAHEDGLEDDAPAD